MISGRRAQPRDFETQLDRGGSMKSMALTVLATGVVVAVLGAPVALAQSGDTAEAHRAAAKAAAGQDFVGLLSSVCPEPRAQTAPAGPRRQGPPPASEWHVEPVKVFDNLYFVGQSEYSAWAVSTSDGIIVIDTIFDYSVEDEVVNGLKKLGLDPSKIKYAIVSHGHGDHSGGAKFLQDRFGTRVILSAADWDLLDRSSGTKPKRDIVATDGQKLTLGDTTITIYVTPGHTLGTLSTLIPVKDSGKPHLAASWGGTGFNWLSGSPVYITPDRPNKFWFDNYIASAARFRDIVAKAGADVIIANHTHLDDAKNKLPAMAKRRPPDPNPYVIGNDAVVRYVTVASECAQAGLAR